MSWVATAGGVILGPIVGALAARVITDQVKPKELSTTLLIGAGAHAAAAVGAYALGDMAHEENVHAFAYGATWGSGISAGILGAGGLYAKTDGGKLALARFAPAQAPSTGREHNYGKSAVGALGYGGQGCPAPSGLLGLLTAAKAHGY